MCNEKCVHGPCFKLLFTFSEIRGRTSPAISTDWLHSVALSNPDLKMPATRGLSLRPKGDPYCEKLFQNWRALIGRQFQTETGHRRSSESRNTTAKSASGEVCNRLLKPPGARRSLASNLASLQTYLHLLAAPLLIWTYYVEIFTAGQQNYGQLRLYHSNVFIH